MTENHEIIAKERNVTELLKGVKYKLDYYQRDFEWKKDHFQKFVTDLTEKFFLDFNPSHDPERVASYSTYFLGEIIICHEGASRKLIDGQQRLTSLTLLLIYFRNFLKFHGLDEETNIDEYILSAPYSKRSYNLDFEDRTSCIDGLFKNNEFDSEGQSETVINLCERFSEIDSNLPDQLKISPNDDKNSAVIHFIYWLINRVMFAEITVKSESDAYTIFETMNDRGLSLSPTDLLKGFILSRIDSEGNKKEATKIWRKSISELRGIDNGLESDCIKSWFRSQFSNKIRERKKGAKFEDFDRIGVEFHRWFQQEGVNQIGLNSSKKFYNFIERDFSFYSNQFLRLTKASKEFVPGIKHVRYLSELISSLQYMVLLSPLNPEDDRKLIDKKIELTAIFIEIYLMRRVWDSKNIDYSNMQYSMFNIMKNIRGKNCKQLIEYFKKYLKKEVSEFGENQLLVLSSKNRKNVHRCLSRITEYIEINSKMKSNYDDYLVKGQNRYEIEHVWPDDYNAFQEVFNDIKHFEDWRNSIGGLILLPRSINASLGANSYKVKREIYNGQNILARTFHPKCYENNPNFLKFVKGSKLPFKPYGKFEWPQLEERGDLYCSIANLIWNPEKLKE